MIPARCHGRILSFLLLGAMLLVPPSVNAQVDQEKVKKVKAAYLLNFLKFTRWPDDAFEDERSPIVIAVVGRDPLGRVLDQTMRGKRVNGREIRIRRIPIAEEDRRENGRYSSAARQRLRSALDESHVAYLSRSEEKHVGPLVDELAHSALLTVGDDRYFAEAGTMLAVGLREGRVVFYANRGVIGRSPLEISSKVLRLAKIVD